MAVARDSTFTGPLRGGRASSGRALFMEVCLVGSLSSGISFDTALTAMASYLGNVILPIAPGWRCVLAYTSLRIARGPANAT